MILLSIIWMTVNHLATLPPTCHQRWCQIVSANPITDLEIATTRSDPNRWTRNMILIANLMSLNNYTWTSRKMIKSIIHIPSKNKNFSNRMLFHLLVTKKRQMEKMLQRRRWDHQRFLFINKFQRLRSILQNGSYSKIWWRIWEVLLIKVKSLKNYKSTQSASTFSIVSVPTTVLTLKILIKRI